MYYLGVCLEGQNEATISRNLSHEDLKLKYTRSGRVMQMQYKALHKYSCLIILNLWESGKVVRFVSHSNKLLLFIGINDAQIKFG